AACGNSESAALSSWSETASGLAVRSQSSRLARRLLTLLMLKVAIFIPSVQLLLKSVRQERRSVAEPTSQWGRLRSKLWRSWLRKSIGPRPGRQALCAAREKGRLATWRARVGYRPASKAKASSARHLLVTSGGRFISRAADYSSDFCKTETESAGERAYIRHRSPAPLGTRIL